MDDPLATLAPSDPTWNPSNTVPPEAMVSAPPGTPPAAAPAAAAPPPVEAVPQNYSPSIPSETAPNNPDIERTYHEENWRRILDKVGSILGGDQTIHVTKDKDGNVTLTHDPSTSGEKWGRIAATALGGAAQGVANSQGPGGPVRAAAAGTAFGLQQPQQRQQEADAQATAEQKRMQANANNALIQQRLYTASLESQALQTKLTGDQATMVNDYAEDLKASPNAKDYGIISGPEDLQRVMTQNPDFFKHHTNLQLKAVPVPDSKGGVALHAIATDPGDDAQPVPKGAYLFTVDADPKTGEPILSREDVSPGSRKVGELRTANQAQLQKFMTAKNAYQKSQDDKNKAEKDKVPTTAAAAIAQAALTTDPDEKKRLLDAVPRMQAAEESLRRAGRSTTSINNTPSSPDAIKNWADALSDPRNNVTLAQVKPADRNAVLDYMQKNGLKPTHTLTAKELERSDLAGNALSNLASAQAVWQKRPDLFGPAGYGKSKMQQALEGGDPDALAFQTAITLANLPAVGIHGVRGKWALEDLAKYDSNLWLNHESMGRVLGEITRSANEFAPAGGRQLPGQTPAAAAPAAAAATPTPPKGAAVQPPTGATMEYKDAQGNVTGWAVNGKYVSR